MDIAQLLKPLLLTPNRKGVIANLPEMWKTHYLELAGSNLFEYLENNREFGTLRLTNEQMNVLGHDYVSNDVASVPAANSIQLVFKRVSRRSRVEQFHAVITTEGDEM